MDNQKCQECHGSGAVTRATDTGSTRTPIRARATGECEYCAGSGECPSCHGNSTTSTTARPTITHRPKRRTEGEW